MHHGAMLDLSRPDRLSGDSHPLQLLFRAPAILWVLLAGEALAAILSLAPGVAIARWAYFGLMSLLIQWIALLSLGVLYLARGPLTRLSPRVVAWLAVLALLLVSCALGTLGAIFVPRIWSSATVDWKDVSLQMSAMMAVVGVLSALVFENHWRSTRLALRAKQAELATLQARIHPHFLFNTLNSAAALVHARPDDAERVLLDLGDLFRAALSEPGWVPLSHELELCRRYLAIEQQRFGDRLRVEWRIDEGLDALSVPLLTITRWCTGWTSAPARNR
jgi:two-component system sensor histidine kinase AlgZ